MALSRRFSSPIFKLATRSRRVSINLRVESPPEAARLSPVGGQGEIFRDGHGWGRAAERILENAADQPGPAMLWPARYVHTRQFDAAFVHEK